MLALSNPLNPSGGTDPQPGTPTVIAQNIKRLVKHLDRLEVKPA
jgi:hypothetical protein